MRKYDVILDVNESSISVEGREYLTFYIAGGDAALEERIQKYLDTCQGIDETITCEDCDLFELCGKHQQMIVGSYKWPT